MANRLPGSTVLADAEKIIIIPLPSATRRYIAQSLCFSTWEYDPETREERQICCIHLAHLSPSLRAHPKVPILFEIVGQIAREDCFLTAEGYESPESSGQDDEHLATCWIEARNDCMSRIHWQGVVPAIQEIGNHVSGDLDTSRLLAEYHGKTQLQICYQPPAGESITSTLPFYNIDGAREVPFCAAVVPFGRPVRAAFALESCYSSDEPDKWVLVAVLEHMAVI